jgi:bifunctional non-homologous end joining protein LigD
VPAYVVRTVPNATVSMPLHWDEVNGTLDPQRFTIAATLERIKKLGTDPLSGLLQNRV